LKKKKQQRQKRNQKGGKKKWQKDWVRDNRAQPELGAKKTYTEREERGGRIRHALKNGEKRGGEMHSTARKRVGEV